MTHLRLAATRSLRSGARATRPTLRSEDSASRLTELCQSFPCPVYLRKNPHPDRRLGKNQGCEEQYRRDGDHRRSQELPPPLFTLPLSDRQVLWSVSGLFLFLPLVHRSAADDGEPGAAVACESQGNHTPCLQILELQLLLATLNQDLSAGHARCARPRPSWWRQCACRRGRTPRS